MAFFIFVTSRFHVRGGVLPSSKNERGIVAAVGRLNVVLVKAVAAAIEGVWPVFEKVSLRPALVMGDWPFIESMEMEGDKPSLANVWRVRP
jgi:hypothetical protein